jgi:Nucleotidyl transferase AbiEii toxin, Type IV TA system
MSGDPALVQSVRQRLTNLARQRGEDVQRVFVRYGIERLLYRLSLSKYKDRFVLKGATLFSLWADAPYRSTGDVDLLGSGDNAAEKMQAIFSEIAAIDPEPADGLVFETAKMTSGLLRADTKYAGVSLRFDALLGRARLPMMIDIGYGDVITPGPEDLQFPSLIGMPTPRLKAYPPQTVIAEKVEAMAALGLANSRVKDLYDLWAISLAFDLAGEGVIAALQETFKRRGAQLKAGRPSMLTPGYTGDPNKQALWRAFLSNRAEIANAPADLAAMAEDVALFIEPALTAAANGAVLGVWDKERRTWSDIQS